MRKYHGRIVVFAERLDSKQKIFDRYFEIGNPKDSKNFHFLQFFLDLQTNNRKKSDITLLLKQTVLDEEKIYRGNAGFDVSYVENKGFAEMHGKVENTIIITLAALKRKARVNFGFVTEFYQDYTLYVHQEQIISKSKLFSRIQIGFCFYFSFERKKIWKKYYGN